MDQSFYEKECLPYVKSIANQIDELADGIDLDELRERIDELENLDNADDFTDNPSYNPDDDDLDVEAYILTEDAQKELDELREKLAEYESGGEPADLYEYISDCLDVEYRVDASGKYKSVALTVTTGGPHVEIDTADDTVKLWWGGDHAKWSFSSKAGDMIDDIYSEYYQSMR